MKGRNDTMKETTYELGMIGLGVMGRNLLLNMADHGFSVAGYDKDVNKVQSLKKESEGSAVGGAESLKDLVGHLREPRVVMLLIPAGSPVDAVIRELAPLLSPGDMIIDGGNSYFRDTERRSTELREKDISFLGVGISGGESGARRGPSIMPGGPKEAYERVRPVFEAIAARVSKKPCVTYLGPGSAGHYVKMVHNGIEYGLMQLIAETFHLMKQSMGLTNDSLHSIYAQWDKTELNSFLVEITASIFAQKDDRTGKYLVDLILDEAGQKGTGLWSSQEAMTLGVPLPTVDLAVMMRQLSDLKEYRVNASRIHDNVGRAFQGDQDAFIEQVRNALYAAMLITYSQGMSLLRVASDTYKYNLNLEDIARIWQGGCIIRAALLEKIRIAYEAKPQLRSLLLDSGIVKDIFDRQQHLRAVVQLAVGLAIPIPGLSVSLAYMDGYRSSWLPANLIQAQRDYFGAHSYERVDAAGVFHTEWREAS
jgi:6-phosphogluconate dehydrogenase